MKSKPLFVLLALVAVIAIPTLFSYADEEQIFFTFSTPSISFATTTPLHLPEQPFSIFAGPSLFSDYFSHTSDAPYAVSFDASCAEEDENGDCIRYDNSLCSYLFLEPADDHPNSGKIQEGFFAGNYGGILNPDSLTDTWNAVIHAPCFEGECPADYDHDQFGDPLPQDLKGQIFSCDLGVYLAEIPSASYEWNPLASHTTYASDVYTTIHVSAILGGVPTTIPVEPPVETKVPVLFIPGLMGTEMKKGNELLWADPVNMFLIPGDRFMDPLAYNPDGSPTDTTLVLGGVITEKPRLDYTTGLTNEFLSPVRGYSTSTNFFLFPYDWRKDIGDVADNELKDRILSLTSSSPTGKIDIIAHSQGGLVIKKLLLDHPEYQSKIRKLIFLGTPQLGAPKAAKGLLYGDDFDITFGIWGLDPKEVKYISHNMPAVYQLLPSPAYFNHALSYLGLETQHLFSEPTTEVLTGYANTTEALKSAGLNDTLIDRAASFHENFLDGFDFSHTGIEVTNIVGCRTPTTGLIVQRSWGRSYLYPIPGDGTVPYISARAVNGATRTLYSWTPETQHSAMPSNPTLRTRVADILTSITSEPAPYLSFTDDKCGLSGWQFSSHSPVDLNIYDAHGNHLGPTPDGGFEANIPGSTYDTIGEEKFAFVPEGNYTVKLNATGAGGFSFFSTKYENNEPVSTASYLDIPISTTSKANIIINTTNTQTIALNTNGDNITDQIIAPNAVLHGPALDDLTSPTTTASTTGTLGTNNWYISNVIVTLTATDTGSGVAKTNYSFNNGASWLTYTAPISITNEGSATMLFYSTDKAGNRSATSSLTVKIDKTAPEANVSVSTSTKDLNIAGSDALGTTTVTKNATGTYTITDQAGHTIKLFFTTTYSGKLLAFAQLTKMQYDAAPVITVKKSSFLYIWDSTITPPLPVSQTVAVNDTFAITALYDKKKNKTSIIVLKAGAQLQTQTFTGLEIVKLVTNRGVIGYR